jgi:D-arabinose 1-dehydrogenase-like Zn-dependent alcohol dehydrogenase
LADPKPHERIAVVGIGALGHLGIQYSKAAGFETIAVTHSKDKEELAYKLGANSVVSDGEGLLKQKGQHGDSSPDGGGADVILATSNSYKATADAIKGLRPDGRVILMGVSSTETPGLRTTIQGYCFYQSAIPFVRFVSQKTKIRMKQEDIND